MAPAIKLASRRELARQYAEAAPVINNHATAIEELRAVAETFKAELNRANERLDQHRLELNALQAKKKWWQW